MLRLLEFLETSPHWNQLRSKIWHVGLLLAAAYCARHVEWDWATVVLVGAAGMSEPPNGRKGQTIVARPARTIEREDGTWRDTHEPPK